MPDDLRAREDPAVTRPFWSGTITFGLVSIPVQLYAANRSRRVSLRMVSPEGAPLARRYFARKDERPLDADDIVRGYEVETDRFVVVDDDELERLAPEMTRDIDLRQFVDASAIDPMYFERAYYLTPAGNSTKAYRLLARVMEETERAGIATLVMRAKEYLVAIIAEKGILRAETLRFADELRTPEHVGLPAPATPKPAEVKKIDREIGKRVEKTLDRGALVDRSADRLLTVVHDKLRAGEDVVRPEERDDEEGGADVIDLMAVLKARLQGGADAPVSRGGSSSSAGVEDLEDATKTELYERAKALDIPGRSGMSKAQLVRAIRKTA